ncbi:MAG: 4Fe-4S dicluster domain-containing protein [Thermoanaerobaculales bacterium]
MARWGMVIDLERCTGCGACMAACHQENNLPTAGRSETVEESRAFHWIKLMPQRSGAYPNVSLRFLPQPCFHCDNPPCVRVCPVQATYLSSEGIVGQIYGRCIGCRYCMAGCPYSAKVFNWYAPNWPGQTKKRTNPDVSLRPKGVVEKCTFCHHRIIKAREDARIAGHGLRDGDVTPACAESCPTQAIIFGDLELANSRVSQLAQDPRAFRLHDDLGTRPKVIYLGEKA